MMAQLAVPFFPGDPDAISKVPGAENINYLNECATRENLQILNLM